MFLRETRSHIAQYYVPWHIGNGNCYLLGFFLLFCFFEKHRKNVVTHRIAIMSCSDTLSCQYVLNHVLRNRKENQCLDKHCHEVDAWKKSVVNYLYWSVSSSYSGEETVAKWKSVANHIQHVHAHNSYPPFPTAWTSLLSVTKPGSGYSQVCLY